MDGRQLTGRGGFTLVEVLVASVILGAGAAVIWGLTRHCAESNERGAEYEQAYRLLDEVLDRLTVEGVAPNAGAGTIAGGFGRRYPGYQWAAEVEAAERMAGLYKVTATVSWEVLGQRYGEQVTTLVYDGGGINKQ